jgi:hypothetical protein
MSKTTTTSHLTAADALEKIKADPEMKRLHEQALQVLHRNSADSLRSHFELGRIGVTIKNDPNRKLKSASRMHGDGAVDVMAKALGMHRATFRLAIHVVEVFSAEQLESFLTRRSVDGFLIQPSHLRIILPIPSAAHRHHLIEWFYAKSPSVRQLADEAMRLLPQAGRVATRPRNLATTVAKIRSMAKSLHAKLTTDAEPVLFTKLQEMVDGQGSSSPDDQMHVSRLREQLETLRDGIDATLALADKAEAAIEDRLGTAAA